MININPFSNENWSADLDIEIKKLEFNFGIKIGWDGNQWFIKGYEWTFSNLEEVKRFCRSYL